MPVRMNPSDLDDHQAKAFIMSIIDDFERVEGDEWDEFMEQLGILNQMVRTRQSQNKEPGNPAQMEKRIGKVALHLDCISADLDSRKFGRMELAKMGVLDKLDGLKDKVSIIMNANLAAEGEVRFQHEAHLHCRSSGGDKLGSGQSNFEWVYYGDKRAGIVYYNDADPSDKYPFVFATINRIVFENNHWVAHVWHGAKSKEDAIRACLSEPVINSEDSIKVNYGFTPQDRRKVQGN